MLKAINQMDVWELFNTVLFYPEYIRDSYYKEVSKVINERFEYLKKEHYCQTQLSKSKQEV